MNIQLDAQSKKSTTSIFRSVTTKGIRLLKALHEFITAKETDIEKRKNELDYFDYVQLDVPEDK